MTLTVSGIAILLIPFPMPGIAEPLFVLLGLYALGAYRSPRWAWIALAAAVLASAIGTTYGMGMLPARGGSPAVAGSTVPLSASTMLVATLAGTTIGTRRRYVAALVDRAEQLARERDQQAQIATARERGRIAGEMHDVIAHSVSVMIAMAEGAVATKDDTAARDAMTTVAETGRTTLGEVRRLLGVLHDGEDGRAPRAPQPGASSLTELFDGFRAAGLRLQSSVVGTASGDESIGLTVYRIAQEALTNALRYAGPTRVEATVTWQADTVRILVVDHGSRRDLPSQGAGRGLVGIRERAALYAGTVETGPRPTGGWAVDVRLHHGGTA